MDSLNAKDIKKKLLEDYGVENVDMHVIYSLLYPIFISIFNLNIIFA